MVLFKPSVRFKRLTPALLRILTVLFDLDNTRYAVIEGGIPEDLVVTSVNDSKHMQGSRHYTDEAVDLRTHNFPSKASRRAFRDLLKDRLPGFDVILEAEGTANEHIHIERA